MEHKQFTSDDLNHSPYKTFLARVDRFVKRSNNLNIPDTIPENSGAELSEANLKMEVSQFTTENFRGENKENISVNLEIKHNESMNNSTNISIDNSYIRQCEKRFLESSNSEDEKSIESDEVVNKRFMEVQRKLIYPNDTISTPPSLLRKEISLLRSEMAEAHEFHDFEIQVLKEEKLNEADSCNYLELFEKYSALMELYTTLKTEYDEYRKDQEKITQEYQSKTADCLEFLCSQIEASDNSLNFSSASFVSFNGGIKSSTMMEDFSEVEATVVHDATVLANDPLSITSDTVFKTPMQTPLKSTKKLSEEELNLTAGKPVLKEIIDKPRSPMSLHSEYNIQLLNLETALCDKIKEVEDLEQRLFKVEDLSSVLQNEFERITSIYAEENNGLKESLVKTTEQLNELNQRLFTETISLNPSLRESLIDISGMKLLVVFIETIMERCKNIQNEEMAKYNAEKTDWEAKRKSELNTIEDLQNQVSLKLAELENFKKKCENLEMKLCNAESTILTRDEEILKLKSQVSPIRQTEEDSNLMRETFSELESRLTLTEAEKKAAENLYRELETDVENLKQEIEINGKLRSELENQLLSSEEKKAEIESENIRLKHLCDELKDQMAAVENILKSNDCQLTAFKENLRSADETTLQLKSQLKSVEVEKTSLETRYCELETVVENLKQEIEINGKLRSELENQLLSSEEKKAEIESENIRLKHLCDELKDQMAAVENILKSNDCQLTAFKENLRSADETILQLKSQLKSVEVEKTSLENRYSELQENNQRLRDNIDSNKSEKNISENEKILNENDDLKRRILEKEKIMAELKTELELAKEKQMNNFRKIEELTKEIEEVKKENSAFSKTLDTVEDSQKTLTNLLSDVKNHSDLPSDRITELIENSLKFQEPVKARETKIISTFMEIIMTTCKEVQNELMERYDNKRFEWETQRNVDLNLIMNLQTQIKCLTEKSAEDEAKLSEINLEKENLTELFENLKTQMMEAEKIISIDKEEIKTLKSQENILKQMKHDLSAANGTIEELRSQLSLALTKKAEVENRCRQLEENILSFQNEIETKETIIKELNEVKIIWENVDNENDDLKQQILKSEEVVVLLKKNLEEAEKEQRNGELRMQTLQDEISLLKKELKSIEVEKSEMEKQCTKLQESNQNLRIEIIAAKNLESSPLYEKIQTENNDLKKSIIESEKVITELKNELEFAKEDQTSKVEELIRKIEELRKENNYLSGVFKTVEEFQKNLANVLWDVRNDSDLLSDRITKLIIQNSNVPDPEDKQNKIVYNFVKTISEICEGVQNAMIKKFDNKILEWESQKEIDLQNFQEQIKQLTEKKTYYEAIIKQTKEDLAAADETILQLKSQLSVIQTEKAEMEIRLQKLEEGTLSLQTEIDTKETIIKGLDELKIVWKKIEIENDDLKQQILESEEVVIHLKNCLEVNKEEQSRKEIKIQDLQDEIVLLRKEQEDLIILSGKLESTEKNYKNLLNILSDIQFHLDMPEDTLTKLLSDNFKNKKIFSEKINSFVKTQMEGLKAENKNLKFGIDNLKEKVKQLTKLIGETANNDLKEALVNLNNSHPYSMSLRSKSKSIDICVRRLDKLEEINHNLTELLSRILSMTEFPDLEKLKLCSVRDFPNVLKKVITHFSVLESKMKELKEENSQLDEECETYANIIKDLKKEAAAVWKTNKEKMEALESKINELNEEKKILENEKQDLLAKISKIEEESNKVKSFLKTEEPFHNCTCGNESKKINELKRTILLKEQKLLDLQDLESQIGTYKSQIEYLKTALEREKKKVGEEKEKNRKLQNELNETNKNQKTENKRTDENQILDELRMRGSISGGIVQEFVDKEKMRKLSKDIGILKELCRARYAEIKRLEALNAALRNGTSKNSNQMDSPLRSRGYNTRSKMQVKDLWRTEINGKENSAV